MINSFIIGIAYLPVAAGSPGPLDRKIPFGFKLNGFVTTKLQESYTSVFLGKKTNPNEILGKRKDLTPIRMQAIAKKFIENGATIIGGCCETGPSHIEAMAKIK